MFTKGWVLCILLVACGANWMHGFGAKGDCPTRSALSGTKQEETGSFALMDIGPLDLALDNMPMLIELPISPSGMAEGVLLPMEHFLDVLVCLVFIPVRDSLPQISALIRMISHAKNLYTNLKILLV